MKPYVARIRREYLNSASGDSTSLFQTVLAVARQIDLDRSLAILEQCVSEKRIAWLGQNLGHFEKVGVPVLDGYRLFYEIYLGLAIPRDGEIVNLSATRLVTRWRNRCPTLNACQKLGLDTREICRKVYHRPVQIFLSKIDPRLYFDRTYRTLRPYGPCCEEIITLEG